MKIRQGFVSNSSTSSFVLYGVKMTPAQYDAEVYGQRGISDYIWGLRRDPQFAGLTAEQGCENFSPSDFIIGLSPGAMQEDETLRQFKQRVAATLTAARFLRSPKTSSCVSTLATTIAKDKMTDKEREDWAAHNRKNPIYGTDFSKPISTLVGDLRQGLLDVRGKLHDLRFGYPHLRDRLDKVDGLIDCGVIAIYYDLEEIIKWEIQDGDRKFGPSIEFRSRGIGSDMCPGCFVCGTKSAIEDGDECLSNIAAFVPSKADGEAVVAMFDGKARLDFREREPNWIQIKVGACDKHLPNLNWLHETTHANHGRIRACDIKTAKGNLPNEKIKTNNQAE